MINKLNTCYICGSEELVKTGEKAIEDGIFVEYRCNACMEEISAYSVYLEKEKAKSKSTKKQQIAVQLDQTRSSAVEIYEMSKASVLQIFAEMDNGDTATGSGFIVSSKGYVITNAHVVSRYEKSKGIQNLRFHSSVGGAYVGAKEKTCMDIVFVDWKRDLALLKLDCEKEYIPLKVGAYSALKTGEDIFAVGNSKGQGIIITNGIVSDRSRNFDGLNYILLTAAVNTGNSGGPLLNASGEVVGVIVASEKNAVGMSYAIPSDELLMFISKAEEKEDIKVI